MLSYRLVVLYTLLYVTFRGVSCLGPCDRSANCTPLTTTSRQCFGTTLSYSHTSTDLVNSSWEISDLHLNLNTWSKLQALPKCWQIVRPLLCAVYMPKCNNSRIELYTRALCLEARDSCQIAVDYDGGRWPPFLDCQQSHFTTEESCSADTYTKKKYVGGAFCEYPLVNTDQEKSYYRNIDGCGMQCNNPAFSESEHQSVHMVTAVMGSLCLIFTLVTLLTFAIDWRNSNRYPAVAIFFLALCFFFGSIGWMAQFSGHEARTDIVCRQDGTLRSGEPQIGSGKETASCTIVFFVVYYFSSAACCWFVILTYSWHISFKKLQSGSVHDKLKGKIAYFHIVSWTLPLVCSIIAMTIQKIDGDSLTGICFVGFTDSTARGSLLLLPVLVSLCAGFTFLAQGIIRLVKLRETSNDVQNNKATAKITATIIRLSIFSVLIIMLVIMTFGIHIYNFVNKQAWEESLYNYTLCTILERSTTCNIVNRPALATVYLNIIAYFGTGILVSSWTWTKASKETWKRFFRRLFRLPTNKPIKLKSRHKIISHAFQQKRSNGKRKLSLDFHTSHDDPLGMKFDMASVTSQDMSSAWIDSIPKLVTRRGGIALPVAGTLRRYSDSDISSMVASRRASIDSQISEMEKALKSKKKKSGAEHRSHRALTKINPADIIAFNARRKNSNLGQKDLQDFKLHMSRQISDCPDASDASAHNISLDCGEAPQSEHSSRKSSVDGGADDSLHARVEHLEELTLATYSLFTATAFLPGNQPDRASSKPAPGNTNNKANNHPSRGGSSLRKGPLTPDQGFVNGAVDDAEMSDISL